MQLNRTERMLLETAAEMFCLSWSSAQAAMLTELELTAEETQRWNGTRPQLGELLVARGELTRDMLDQVLDTVYGDVQQWSDRLASPKPKPVPKPAPAPQTPVAGELAELVTQLTGLLDLLVGGQAPSLENRSTRRVTRPRRAVDTILPTPPLHRAKPSTVEPPAAPKPAWSDDEDAPTVDFKPAAAPTPAADPDDPDAPTMHIERAPEPEERPTTLQVERAAETQIDDVHAAETLLDEPEDGDTLHLERPVESHDDGDTLHIERLPAPKDDGPTLQLERPAPREDTLQLERTAVAGDTVQLERGELSESK